jgi:hypothetical protein
MSRRPLVVALGAVALIGGVIATSVAALNAPRAPASANPTPHFVGEAEAAGLRQAYDGDWDFIVGGGVAVLDCNGDRRPDLYVAGGSGPAHLFRNVSPMGGALRFTALPDPATDLPMVTGAYPLDIDDDGIVDLAVLRFGENVLLRGLGDCRFERANEALGFGGGDSWTTSFSATWEGQATLPTLAFGNYTGLDQNEDWDGTCQDDVLVRPDATGRRYARPIALSPSWCTLSMLFSDWDRTGRRDLRVSNDHHYYSDSSDGEEQLWRIAGLDLPRAYTRADGWSMVRIWGMGIASQDLTGDGYPEVFLSNQGDNRLQTLADGPAGPTYRDIAIERGVNAHRPYVGDTALLSTAWHAQFEDFNNDTLMDLYIAKGNVEAMPEYAAKDPSNLLIGQADGTFTEGAEDAGIVDFARGRGAAAVDLNLDGLLDLVKVNRRVNVNLWRNVGSGTADEPAPVGTWTAIELLQPGPNRDAIGSWISVKVGDRIVEREVTIGGGHAGGQLGPIHFGLGSAEQAEVRVTWPDGEVGPWQTIRANEPVTIERGAGEPRPWTLPAG